MTQIGYIVCLKSRCVHGAEVRDGRAKHGLMVLGSVCFPWDFSWPLIIRPVIVLLNLWGISSED